MTQGSTQIDLNGRAYAYPIFLAPVAWQRWAHPEGELATAQAAAAMGAPFMVRSEEHTSELQSRGQVVCRLLLEKKKWGEQQRGSTDLQYRQRFEPDHDA